MSNLFYPTLNDVMELFAKKYPKKRQVISVVNRFLLPTFGLELSSSRMTKIEQQNAKLLAKQIEIKNFNREEIINGVRKTFEVNNLTKSKQKSPLSHINFFLDFLESEHLLKPEDNKPEEDKLNFHKLSARVIDKSYLEKTDKVPHKYRISLYFQPEKYLDDYPGLNKQKKIKIIQQELDRIAKEVKDFESCYQARTGSRNVTVGIHHDELLRILGWQYLREKKLSKVSLSSIIKTPKDKLNFLEFDNTSDYYEAKLRLEFQAKKDADFTIKWFEDFFADYDVKEQSRSFYLRTAIEIAKFLAKDATDKNDYLNFEDVVVVRRLRVLNSKVPNKPNQNKQLYFTWEEILKVREAFRKDSISKFSLSERSDRKYIARKKRVSHAQALSLMKFLILCFLTVVPPDRSRTIRELRIGETLRYGLNTKTNFIPYEQLEDKKLAKYYIYLGDEDYKTGKFSHEFLGELPNIVFEDKSSFYQYLDKWLFQGWREIILKKHGQYKNHDFFFLRYRDDSLPLTVADFYNFVANAFFSKTGFKLNPHRFRHIFCSYLDEIGVSPEERESVAWWMHHSVDIAKSVYTIKNMEQKAKPGLRLMRKIAGEKVEGE